MLELQQCFFHEKIHLLLLLLLLLLLFLLLFIIIIIIIIFIIIIGGGEQVPRAPMLTTISSKVALIENFSQILSF